MTDVKNVVGLRQSLFDLLVPGSFPEFFYRVGR